MDTLLHEHLEAGGACVMSTHGSLRPVGIELTECELRVPGTAS